MTPEAMERAFPSDVSEDVLLGGRVRFLQPKQGYRTAMDTVFLAAAVKARAGESVLDAGCGVGAAALCLAVRVPGVRVTGIESQADLIALAERNSRLNHVVDRVSFVTGNILSPPPSRFDHVMVNPPFHEQARTQKSPHAGKAMANQESGATLATWIDFCHAATAERGTLTVIHRADRIDDLLAALHGRFGGIVVYPLWPGPAPAAKPAKRILVRGRKGSGSPATLSGGIVLHLAGGAYTPEADAVLRDGRGLDF